MLTVYIAMRLHYRLVIIKQKMEKYVKKTKTFMSKKLE